jgi:hypothetical protein
MSAVAALAVTSPIALSIAYEVATSGPAPQHRQFVQADLVTDLPSQLMSALSQGLSQFGVNIPPMPNMLGGPSMPSTSLTPGLGGLTNPALGGLTNPALGGLTNPGITQPAGAPGLSTPSVGTLPSLTDPNLANPALTNPALATPAGLPGTLPGTLPGGLTSGLPGTLPGGLTSGLPGTLPGGLTGGLPNEVPISAPIGLDPAMNGYPVLGGDTGLGMPTGGGSGGGLMSDLSQAASQLGVGQAIDLLKGMVMPAIMSLAKPPLPAPPVPVPPLPTT